jgi:hypothetical protein
VKTGALLASATLMLVLSSGAALAQPGPPRPSGGGGLDTPGSRSQAEDPRQLESVEAAQEPFALNRRDRQVRAVPASATQIVAGGVVRDRNHAFLGTIASVNESAAVVRFGEGQTAPVPLNAFWNLGGNLTLAVTRSDFHRIAAAYAASRSRDVEAVDDQAD